MDNVTFSYTHDEVGRVLSEGISHAAYEYEASIDLVTYGAVSAINTYPTVDGVAFGYEDTGSINPNLLSSDGAIHTALPWRYRYDGHGNLRNAATNSYASQTNYYYDALGERFLTTHYDTQAGPQTSFNGFSDGLRPEVIQEPTYSRPTNSGAWTAGAVRSYVLGPLPDERLIYMQRTGAGTPVIYYPHTDRRGSTVALSRGAAGQGTSYRPCAGATDARDPEAVAVVDPAGG